MLPIQQANPEATWGAIQWRPTHKYDTAEDQRRGWKCFGSVTKPVTLTAINEYIRLVKSDLHAIESYQFDVVLFDEQENRVALKLGELTGWGVPGRGRDPRSDGLPVATDKLGIQWRGD